jgi:hypothetical protein
MQIRISRPAILPLFTYCNDAICLQCDTYRIRNLERNHVDLSSNNIYSQKGNSQPNFDENDKVYDRWTGEQKNEAK